MHYFSSREHWRVVSAFQWLLIVSDLRSMSLWEGDENCWCIFFGSNVSASRNTERAMYWKWDVSGLRGNLLKLPELTVHGLLSLRFDESSIFCFNISRTDFFFPRRMMKTLYFLLNCLNCVVLCVCRLHICYYQMMFGCMVEEEGDLLCIFIWKSVCKQNSTCRLITKCELN